MTERLDSRLGLKLLALGMATLLWFFSFINRPRELGMRPVDASVSYLLPDTMILLDAVSTVTVRIQGEPQKLASLDERMVRLVVDLSDQEAGRQEIPITPDRISVPGDFEPVSVAPSTLSLELDFVESKPLPVQVQYEGEPAAGSLPLSYKVEPREVKASGPRSIVEGFSYQIAIVNLDTHAVSFEETVELSRPHPLVSLQPPRVRVEIQMESPGLSGTALGSSAAPGTGLRGEDRDASNLQGAQLGETSGRQPRNGAS